MSARFGGRSFHELKQDWIVNVEDEWHSHPAQKWKAGEPMQRKNDDVRVSEKRGEHFARSRKIEWPDRKRLLRMSLFNSRSRQSGSVAPLGEGAGQTEDANGRAADARSDHVEGDEENSAG